MPKPKLYPVKLLLRTDKQTVAAVDAYTKDQHKNSTRSESIRHILKDWLTDRGYLKPE